MQAKYKDLALQMEVHAATLYAVQHGSPTRCPQGCTRWFKYDRH